MRAAGEAHMKRVDVYFMCDEIGERSVKAPVGALNPRLCETANIVTLKGRADQNDGPREY